MSEPKFTKGPWRHYKQPDLFDAKLKKSYVLYGEPDAINPDDGTFPPDQCVCGCGKSHWSCGDGNNAANAQLISCAPEMYWMLEKCRTALRNCGMSCLSEDVFLLLEKARGEE